MWRPRTEAEIQAAIDTGVVRETSSFDAKRMLPPAGRNRDLAKDICAMTIDGGVLLYGLGGDDPTRPDRREPFDLTGAAERIDQVAQTGIAEPPVIEIHDIASDERPGMGYLCVVVPASPRAPHMLTIDGDNRYWGRGATGNRLLTEGEVARLYERRERWEQDRDQLLAHAIDSVPPFTFDLAQVGLVGTIARPVMPSRQLLREAAGTDRVDQFLQQELLRIGREVDPYPDQGTTGLGDAFRISHPEPDLWICEETLDRRSEYQDHLAIGSDGSLTYWHSPVMRPTPRYEETLVVLERSVTRAAYQALATASWLYDRAGFYGPVDVGVAILGIQGAGGASQTVGLRAPIARPPAYGATAYRRHERVTSEELRTRVDRVVRQLLDPLYEVISISDYDPLADR